MKTISTQLDDHLAAVVTSIARCWKITRTDDVQFFFTDHDENIEFPVGSGDIYVALEGFSATAVTTNASLDVDNLNVVGIFDDTSITDEDMAAGLFDYADVRLFVVNWADLTMGNVKMRRGWFGEAIKSPSGLFKVELRGMTQVLQQSVGELYGPECRADLGDHRCKIPIDPDVVQRLTAYEVGDFVKVATDLGADGYAQYENRIYKCVSAGVTAAVEPTYDTTAGNLTEDGGSAGGGTSANYTPGVNFSFNNDIQIDDFKYNFVTSGLNLNANNILIGATVGDSMNNLYNAIIGGPGSGTVYSNLTVPNTVVTASLNGITFVLTIGLADESIPGQNVVLNESSPGAWDVSTLGTDSNPAVFEAQEAWSRNFTVTAASTHRVFNISVTEARDADGWFDGGVVVFDGGDNSGKATEVKTWIQSGGAVTLYLPVGFGIQVGDTGRIYPGCDKRLETCRDIFANLLNMRAEPYLPGRDAALQYPDAK